MGDGMRGNTFNAVQIGRVATVWHPYSKDYGKCGKIVRKAGIGRKGKGWVVVEFDDGSQSAAIPFDKVAIGDNSSAGVE